VIVDGQLKINPYGTPEKHVVVTITEHSDEVTYDGEEHKVTGYDVSIEDETGLYTEADFTFSGTAEAKGTDAGTYDMELEPENFTNTNDNYANVEFVIVDGQLEITRRKITLTSADDEKAYDGTALTNDTVTVNGDGFAAGEGASCDVTGTQTLIGSSENTFTYTLNTGTKADNYEIETVFGTLTVTGDTPIEPEKTTPAAETPYALGDQIPFTISVKNITEETLTGVVVNDLSATILAGSGYTVDSEHQATIAEIAPGATVTVNVAHTVTSEDILAGEYANTAAIRTPDNKIVEVTGSTDQFEEADTTLTMTMEVTNEHEDGTPFGLGETVIYSIDVTNEGTVDLYNVVVTDTVTGISETIDVLHPGETKTFTAEHEVTVDDLLASDELTNDGTATADPVDLANGTEVTPTAAASVTTAIGQDYTLVIRYWIDDTLMEIVEKVLPIGTEYDVVTPEREGYEPDLERVKGTLMADTEVDVHYTARIFKLTIHYRVAETGAILRPDYVVELPYGTEFDVKSPIVEGYYMNHENIKGVMEAHDMEFTVLYTKSSIVIDDPTVPLGIGGAYINVGECIE
ncbi:MAG: hypothetical protein IJK29_00585, partial [Bacteroidales bacterium]|nr:hypothetical protein [Bacteroidales bacterium]